MLRVAFAQTLRPTLHIMLNSGGMDSLLVHDEVVARRHKNTVDEYLSVFADYGQRYSNKEYQAALTIASAYGVRLVVVKLGNLARYEHTTGIVPFRNAELLLAAAQYGITTYLNVLYMGVLAYEINSDKSRGFVRHMEKVLNISHRTQYWTKGKEYQIRTPLRRWTKTEAVRRYLRRGATAPGLLSSTVSCYSDTPLPCGRCASCFKRWVAMVNNDIPETFHHLPWQMYDLDKLRDKLKSYRRGRRKEIEMAYSKMGLWV